MDNQHTPAINQRYGSLQKVAPGVLGLPTLIVNVYFVGDAHNWVLVDAGIARFAGNIRKAAEQVFGPGAKPRAIVLTHGHFDHVGSLEALLKVWDVPVYAHKLEIPYLTGMSSYPPPDPTVGGGAMASMSRVFPTKPLHLGSRVRPFPLIGELPEMPGWEIIHTPGHAPGHVSLFRRRDGVLIAGDAFVTTNQESFWSVVSRKREIHRPPAYFTQDWTAAQRSVEHLANLEPSVVATGHGLPMRGEEMRTALHHLARNFRQEAVPAKGRYVAHPALFNEAGVDYVPPAAPDPLPKLLAGLAVLTLAGVAAYALINRNRKHNELKPMGTRTVYYDPEPPHYRTEEKSSSHIPRVRRITRPEY
jgi:glyoxylase-like metal-dependent hydrolase (beta-lactamase superfamily II)